jgi:uncharacterized membrane protein YraQ (UPF0718 family)
MFFINFFKVEGVGVLLGRGFNFLFSTPIINLNIFVLIFNR